ncbi:redox-sensing transcriptional repressor Rex [Aerococcus sp. HMSC23C02]|uniref:Redox-sensing transcriptional repressor Rex n=1 Tax=Aerococcus sanguinicola TaxID=119206 RepID=A0A109RF00_9LACT|nr:redox-sensing transcriptional repressor Rex [Aerococcus sanguinicola]OFT92488.1 redox-sensing transcriptional repressor Rex [Aerococcus sp. HMSC23C02]
MKKIPKATAKRLSIYYRCLKNFKAMGMDRVSSEQISDAVKVDSATIRRDFSYFGTLGKRGYGYEIDHLIEFFSRLLSQDQLTMVALIGVGNLGNALISYNFKQSNNVHINAAFDIDPEKVGKIHEGVPIYSMDEIVDQLEARQIDIVILAVPSHAAQSVVPQLEEAGVKGILNFSASRLNVPKDMFVQTVDLANELQTLIYYVTHH